MLLWLEARSLWVSWTDGFSLSQSLPDRAGLVRRTMRATPQADLSFAKECRY